MKATQSPINSVSPSHSPRGEDSGRGLKAMIFAAGLGTRLKPITDKMPKALVKISGKPLLWHTIQKLKTAGFDEIIINVHHFADQIIDYVKSNNNFDIRIEFSDERDMLLDTGGGIKKAAWFFNGQPFLVHNVDIISNVDLKVLYDDHLNNNPLATLVVSERETSRYLLFDENLNLKGWTNTQSGEIKSPIENFQPEKYNKLAFSGIQVLDPVIFSYMKNFPDKFSVIDFYLSVCDRENIWAFIPNDLKIIDVGKIDSIREAEKFFT